MSPDDKHHDMHRRRFSEKVFEVLLLAYPRRFREAFGADLLAFFRQDRQRAARCGGLAPVRMWARTLTDLAASAWRQRTRWRRRGARAPAKRQSAIRPARPGAPSPPTALRHGTSMSDLLQDLRYGVRSFAHDPGFAVVAILTLALGVGATTAVFSVIDGVLLRPLPYPEADRLLYVGAFLPNDPDDLGPLSQAALADLREGAVTLDGVAGSGDVSLTLLGAGDPELVDAAEVGRDFFSLLGVHLSVGRGFTDEDFNADAPRVVILRDDFWRLRWGGAPEAIGDTVTLDGEPHTIIGVAPADFHPPEALSGQAEARMWLPLRFTDPPVRTSFGYQGIARLANGAGVHAAAAEIDRIFRSQTERYGLEWDFGGGAVPLRDRTLQNAGDPLLILLLGVGFLLLIACANVANLMLARGTRRGRELAVRRSLGAGGWRLVRQLLTESMALALAGGGAGALLSHWAVEAFKAATPGGVPRIDEVGVDLPVLAVALVLSSMVGILFGSLPALQALRTDASAELRIIPSTRGGREGRHTRALLVVAETALALVLLVGATLLVNSFVQMTRVDPGFDPGGLVSMRVNLRSAYPDSDTWEPLFRELLEGVESIPGVDSASLTTSLPFAGIGIYQQVVPLDTGAEGLEPAYIASTYVSRRHFHTMGMTLIEGDDFGPDQSSDAPLQLIVNRALAQRYWPRAASVIGKRIRMGEGADDEVATVIGVVNSLRYRYDRDQTPEMYFDMARNPWRSMTVVARTDGDPLALTEPLRAALWRIDPDLPIDRIASVEQLAWSSIGQPRFYSALAAVLAAVALALALVGLYGTISYTVGSRVRELGIRMALGARPGAVIVLVLRGGLLLAAIGLLVGTAGSLMVSRLLDSFLFGIAPTDPVTFAMAAGGFFVTALLACWIPARRAARLDPVAALRADG